MKRSAFDASFCSHSDGLFLMEFCAKIPAVPGRKKKLKAIKFKNNAAHVFSVNTPIVLVKLNYLTIVAINSTRNICLNKQHIVRGR